VTLSEITDADKETLRNLSVGSDLGWVGVKRPSDETSQALPFTVTDVTTGSGGSISITAQTPTATQEDDVVYFSIQIDQGSVDVEMTTNMEATTYQVEKLHIQW
jgi:hypothetical protein